MRNAVFTTLNATGVLSINEIAAAKAAIEQAKAEWPEQ